LRKLKALTVLAQGSDNGFDPQGTDWLRTCCFYEGWIFRAGWMSVITIENLGEFPARARGAFVTVGNFDGVHRGHQRLIGRLRARADAAGVAALAVTFDPHPVALLRPDKTPVPLVWPEREIALLREAGATEVAVFRTGRWLLDLTARTFFDQVIRHQFAALGMVEGPNFAFGHDRQGDVMILRQWCAEAGIEFEVVDPIKDADRLISSSRIREALAEGLVEEARRLLGRPHRVRGVVTQGAGRGARLGIPTINLDEIDTLIPLDGVYAARAFIQGDENPVARGWPAACNIGPNPTFGEQIRKVEAHLIDFSGDLYGRTVELEFLARLRSTRVFSSLDELLTQIRADIEETREHWND
jgi:riboflavin kinase/FMN adenylyltransferase